MSTREELVRAVEDAMVAYNAASDVADARATYAADVAYADCWETYAAAHAALVAYDKENT
jgi:hypothetical protein